MDKDGLISNTRAWSISVVKATELKVLFLFIHLKSLPLYEPCSSKDLVSSTEQIGMRWRTLIIYQLVSLQ